jgi:hypothetical protein
MHAVTGDDDDEDDDDDGDRPPEPISSPGWPFLFLGLPTSTRFFLGPGGPLPGLQGVGSPATFPFL